MNQLPKRSRQNAIIGYGFISLSIVGIISGTAQILVSGKLMPGLSTVLFGVVFIIVGIMRVRAKTPS